MFVAVLAVCYLMALLLVVLCLLVMLPLLRVVVCFLVLLVLYFRSNSLAKTMTKSIGESTKCVTRLSGPNPNPEDHENMRTRVG